MHTYSTVCNAHLCTMQGVQCKVQYPHYGCQPSKPACVLCPTLILSLECIVCTVCSLAFCSALKCTLSAVTTMQCTEHSALHSAHQAAQCTVHCTLQCRLGCTVHSAVHTRLHIAHSTVHTRLHSAHCTVQTRLYRSQCTAQCTVQCEGLSGASSVH